MYYAVSITVHLPIAGDSVMTRSPRAKHAMTNQAIGLISKFQIAYFAFLLLFGIILLTDFYPTIGIKEEILIAWVVTILLEEIRQVE